MPAMMSLAPALIRITSSALELRVGQKLVDLLFHGRRAGIAGGIGRGADARIALA